MLPIVKQYTNLFQMLMFSSFADNMAEQLKSRVDG